MSFLESIQHGLEKASQEAARLTKIQHLHNVTTDLTFKTSQEGERLITQAMELYRSGHLAQGELSAICQQIATYQQHISEVQAELQRLSHPEENAEATPPMAPPPPNAPAYPEAPAQPNAQAYPFYPSSSGEPPTQPGTATEEDTTPTQISPVAQAAAPVSNEPPAQPVAHKHTTKKEHAPASPQAPVDAEPATTTAPGSYAQGVLPPVYSPFINHTASDETATEPAGEQPAKAPAKAHHHKAEEKQA